jgi:hypothetical protein
MSDNTLHLKPAPGIVVRDPATMKPLPDGGAVVDGNLSFWTRRIAEGSVLRVAQEALAPVAKDLKAPAAKEIDK